MKTQLYKGEYKLFIIPIYKLLIFKPRNFSYQKCQQVQI